MSISSIEVDTHERQFDLQILRQAIGPIYQQIQLATWSLGEYEGEICSHQPGCLGTSGHCLNEVKSFRPLSGARRLMIWSMVRDFGLVGSGSAVQFFWVFW